MSNPSPAPLLLDTHYWIWLQSATKEHFTPTLLKAVDEAASDSNLLISIISVWELGLLDAKGRVSLYAPCEQFVQEALAMPGLTLAPLTPEIALDSSRLPGDFHGDPADRIIIATARRMGARLLTRDRRILDYARRRHLAVLTG
jgi:PIN domain nuclease of toxin-antitoxin system